MNRELTTQKCPLTSTGTLWHMPTASVITKFKKKKNGGEEEGEAVEGEEGKEEEEGSNRRR